MTLFQALLLVGLLVFAVGAFLLAAYFASHPRLFVPPPVHRTPPPFDRAKVHADLERRKPIHLQPPEEH